MSLEFVIKEDRQSARERLIYNVTEDVLVAMEDLGVSKKELASRISKSKSYVTQMLSGSRNMTVGTLSDICYALDVSLNIDIKLPSFYFEEEVFYNNIKEQKQKQKQKQSRWETIVPPVKGEGKYRPNLCFIQAGLSGSDQNNWRVAS